MKNFKDLHCASPSKGEKPINTEVATSYLAALHPAWAQDSGSNSLLRILRFPTYYQTIAFSSAVAWMTHEQNHHPDLEVGYNRCVIRYTTHGLGGLSENDFICAAKVDSLL